MKIFQDTYLMYSQKVQSKKILTDREFSFNVTKYFSVGPNADTLGIADGRARFISPV